MMASGVNGTAQHQSLAIRDVVLKELTDLKFALDQHAIVAITDVKGRITYANEKFCAISQYSQAELIGQDHRILNSGHHPKVFFRQMYRTLANGEVWYGEIKNRAKDGSIYWVDNTIVPTLSTGGKAYRYISIRTDITERKRAEAAWKKNRDDQLRFKDEFLSHVSHELRSPLTAIKQFTSILLGGLAGDLNAEQQKFQQIVVKNILQLQSMIDDLLEVTRLQTGKLSVEPESVLVSAAVTDSMSTLQGNAHAKDVVLSCHLPPDLPPVYADPTRLRQILIILIDNAIKFTPAGGSVTVQARRLELDPELVLFEVSDTGCGIDPDIVARIFERLFQETSRRQAGRQGLGLGLYICKELVSRQGGQIWVNSQPSKGSVFSFTLPVFCLDYLIAPFLKSDKWPAGSMALVVVEIRHREARPSEGYDGRMSHEVRSLIQRCLMPDRDVLLASVNFALGEGFFVAAFADERGAAVLTNRIRQHIEGYLQAKKADLTLSVSYSTMEPFSTETGASTENIIAAMATNLEQSIKSHKSWEGIRHG